MSYFSWGTYRNFAGCAYSQTLTREAQVPFYQQPRGRCAPTAGKLLGEALTQEITLNPQWCPPVCHNCTKTHQKAGTMTKCAQNGTQR